MNSTYNEIWMTIPNFSKYEISNLGNVKSVDRIVLSKNQSTEFRFNRRSKYIKPFLHNDGYIRVTLYNDQNKRKTWLLHRLVATVFIPNPNNFTEVNHIDRNKQNNCVFNLEWCTKQQNMDHAYRTGFDPGKSNRGKHLSNQHKKAISNSLSNRVINDEWKHNLSIGHIHQQKSVICVEDGLIFNSIQSAANFYGMSRDTVSDSLRLNRTTKFGKTFKPI